MWTLIHFHCGNDSLMGSLVERMLWRNVKRKQGYLNPFHISNFSLATELFSTSSMFCILLVGKSILGLADSHPRLTVILLEPFFLWWCFCNCSFCRAVPVGAVSYADIEGYRYKRDVLFCYDLKLPDSFIPNNQGKIVEPLLAFSSVVVISWYPLNVLNLLLISNIVSLSHIFLCNLI